MAGERTASLPLSVQGGVLRRAAALPARNIRVTVFLCVVLICGSFAAAGALHMRQDRAAARREARYYDTARAADIAAVAEASLRRYESAGREFARAYDPAETGFEPGILGIAVTDSTGQVFRATGAPFDAFPDAAQAQTRTVVAMAGHRAILAFADGGRIVSVLFDPAALVPAALLDHARLATAAGATLAGNGGAGGISAGAGDFPVAAEISQDGEDALDAWAGSLPLYLFLILGPALVGAALAAIFVGEFERRAKAANAIRALKATRPVEAKLLVRLANAEREAVEAQRSKAEFIAHMSHELRTPLNAIIGFAEVIERGFYGPVGHGKYVEYARDIGGAGRNLHAKIGDILEFANLEAGRYPLAPTRFDIGELVCACVNEHVGRAFSRRIALEVMPAPAVAVVADAQGVRRILTNLLSNAMLYTPEGGTVRVVIREEEACVAVAVWDSGGGFTPAERKSIGRPFRRFERVGVSSGAGLGLAIVMALARRMGGAVRLAGNPADGTVAELRLPRG